MEEQNVVDNVNKRAIEEELEKQTAIKVPINPIDVDEDDDIAVSRGEDMVQRQQDEEENNDAEENDEVDETPDLEDEDEGVEQNGEVQSQLTELISATIGEVLDAELATRLDVKFTSLTRRIDTLKKVIVTLQKDQAELSERVSNLELAKFVDESPDPIEDEYDEYSDDDEIEKISDDEKPKSKSRQKKAAKPKSNQNAKKRKAPAQKASPVTKIPKQMVKAIPPPPVKTPQVKSAAPSPVKLKLLDPVPEKPVKGKGAKSVATKPVSNDKLAMEMKMMMAPKPKANTIKPVVGQVKK